MIDARGAIVNQPLPPRALLVEGDLVVKPRSSGKTETLAAGVLEDGPSVVHIGTLEDVVLKGRSAGMLFAYLGREY